MNTARFKKQLTTLCILSAVLLFPSEVFAAVPDGMGPWADSVVSATQGLRKDNSAVPAARSDPSAALGIAEDNTNDGTFYSLGFGGVIELGFDNGISSGVILVEATNAGYPEEKVKIEVSENGVNWVNAGEIAQDGQVAKPEGITCAKYVRLTDVSNKDNFSDGTADGYDVDGVQASGATCTPVTPSPTPSCKDECCDMNVVQGNVSVVKTNIVSVANTGGNKANGNSSDAQIKTGDAKSSVKVTVTGGTNIVHVGSGKSSKSTTVKITGNGAGSKNKVIIGKKK